jgi:transposase-like protein
MTNKLKDIENVFPNERRCIEFLEDILWHNNPVCPYCGNTNKQYIISKLEGRYHCNSCNSSFSVTAKTIFARTRCDLRKWFFAIYLLFAPKNKITVRELAEKIETTKDTAWLLKSKIDKAKISSPQLLESIFLKINN